MQGRGVIMKEQGTMLARPFTKFFNVGEKPSTKPKYLPWKKGFTIWEKMDGSCGIGYQVDGEWKLATPGSMTSDQALVGMEMLSAYNCMALPDGTTPVFEIVYPENRVVVDYGGETFLSLLAIFEHNGEEWHSNRVDAIAVEVGCTRPSRYSFDIDREMNVPFRDNSEGYVVQFTCGKRVKIKSPTYVRIHRLLEYRSPKRVIELIRGREYGTTISQLPKGIQKDFDDIRGLVQTEFDKRVNESHNFYSSMPVGLETRKEQALWIQANVPSVYWPVMFQRLDNKSSDDTIWKMVELSLK
jgi:RNA ligase